jgi:para-nitrobenzyl esterase
MHFAASCRQMVAPKGFGPWTREYVVSGPVDEDCLYLNIWAPADRGRPHAVMVWIHGGGFVAGSGSVPLYDGQALARAGIVVVTINYRLGAFGFAAPPLLAGATPNAGLWDIVAALRWVRAEIGRFGGDPRRITVTGQSAGAIAIHALLASPRARGLFHQAIIQSGLASDRTVGADRGHPWPADPRDARAVEIDALADHDSGRASVDGSILTMSPRAAARVGRTADVPIMIGFNADEASGFGGAQSGIGGWPRACGRSGAMLAISHHGTAEAVARTLARECGRAALLRWFTTRSASLVQPVYAYYFDHAEPGPERSRWGAFHSAEIPYVFGTLAKAPERGFNSDDHRLSALMVQQWTSFVRDGTPNRRGLPRWRQMKRFQSAIMRLGVRPRTEPLLSTRRFIARDVEKNEFSLY